MTVRELIERLREMPPDVIVEMDTYEGTYDLEECEVVTNFGSDQKIVITSVRLK